MARRHEVQWLLQHGNYTVALVRLHASTSEADQLQWRSRRGEAGSVTTMRARCSTEMDLVIGSLRAQRREQRDSRQGITR